MRIGLRWRSGPMCTLSQNGYGVVIAKRSEEQCTNVPWHRSFYLPAKLETQKQCELIGAPRLLYFVLSCRYVTPQASIAQWQSVSLVN